jgi:hypothetical protein
MPKCIACGEEYADEEEHLIDNHNLLGDTYKVNWVLKETLNQPSLLTEIAYYTGLVCLLLAGFIFGAVLMFAYLIIIQ